MGRTELDNTRKLLNLRMRDCKGIPTIAILLFAVFILNMISLFRWTYAYQSEVHLITLSTYSNWAFFFLLIAGILYVYQFGEYNENHQIFPQNKKTQFLSFEIYCYLIHIVAQTLALLFYLLQYAITRILMHRMDNVRLAYPFDLGFIVAGFFDALLYGLILISFIILIYSLVRMLKWWSLVLYVVLTAILWLTREHSILNSIIQFYTQESSLALFYLKALITWIILEALNQIMNQYLHVKSEKRFAYPTAIITLIISITTLMSMFISYNIVATNRNTDFGSSSGTIVSPEETIAYEFNTDLLSGDLYVDAAQISRLNPNCMVSLSAPYDDEDKIKVYFRPEKYISNSINLTAFEDPQLIASLTNNTLSLTLTKKKNINIISMYPYSMLMQFDCFKNKNLAKKEFGTVSGTLTGYVIITVPKNITVSNSNNIIRYAD